MKNPNYNGQEGLLKQIFFPPGSPGNEDPVEFRRQLRNIVQNSQKKIPELAKIDPQNLITSEKRIEEYALLIDILFTMFLESTEKESEVVQAAAKRGNELLRRKFKLNDDNLPIDGEKSQMTDKELATVTLKTDGSGHAKEVNARKSVIYAGQRIQKEFYRRTRQSPR